MNVRVRWPKLCDSFRFPLRSRVSNANASVNPTLISFLCVTSRCAAMLCFIISVRCDYTGGQWPMANASRRVNLSNHRISAISEKYEHERLWCIFLFDLLSFGWKLRDGCGPPLRYQSIVRGLLAKLNSLYKWKHIFEIAFVMQMPRKL